ncbi:MAG: hypothetical protein JWO78_1778, partial [Micavibrio sp.]|nr:hypothetical protein [Micavibrio sp.]
MRGRYYGLTSLTTPTTRHPGLDPGLVPNTVGLSNQSRIKSGMTKERKARNEMKDIEISNGNWALKVMCRITKSFKTDERTIEGRFPSAPHTSFP